MTEKLRNYGGILPCGGKGTRLLELSKDSVPKSLYHVGGKELINYSIESLQPELVKRLVFAVGHKSEVMKSWIESKNFPYIVQISEQSEPGVLESIRVGSDKVEEESMIACNTDEIRLGLNLLDIVKFHEKHNRLATMVVSYANNIHRHRLVEVREVDNLVTRTELKPSSYNAHPEKIGLVNSGFLILEKKAIEYFDSNHSYDWSGIIDPLCDANQLCAYIDNRIKYFNVGTPEEYEEASSFLKQ